MCLCYTDQTEVVLKNQKCNVTFLLSALIEAFSKKCLKEILYIYLIYVWIFIQYTAYEYVVRVSVVAVQPK